MQQYQAQLATFSANAVTSYSQENLLDLLSDFCFKQEVLIKGFTAPQIYQEADYTIVSNTIEVEGDIHRYYAAHL